MQQDYNLPYEQVVGNLAKMTTPDNKVIQQGEKFFKVYCKGTYSTSTLFKVLIEEGRSELRNLSAVMLKKSIIINYEKFSEEEKTWIKRTV